MKPVVSISVLGPVTVLVKGKPAPAPLLWKKPLTLMVYLARSPKRARTREHLVGLLWPEQTDAKAHGSLNEALRLVRAHAGKSIVASVHDQVRLDASGLALDIDEFDRFAAKGLWAEAAALVSGEFMEGFSILDASGVDDWLRVERETWRRKCVDALAHFAGLLSEGGDPAGAAIQAQRALDLDPYSDPALRQLMRALARQGLGGAAFKAFDAFVTRMFEALGTKPDPETVALAERIRGGWVSVRRDTPVPVDRPRRAPLVGRAKELARLRNRRAGMALILGDPGMGKSRLAEEILETAALDGAAIATTRAVEADLGDPWSGLLSLADGGLLSAPGLAAASPGALAAFANRVPSWAERFPAATKSSELPVGKAFGQIVRAICGERPLVLLVEDAQWTDRESLLSLGALLRDVAKLPCFVIVTAAVHPPRVELAELRARLGRGVGGVTVILKPLTMDDLRTLARSVLPSYDTTQIDRVCRRVATDSAGLPLLAVELLRAIAAGLDVLKSGSAWPEPLKTLHQTFPGELPEGVSAAITVNYRRLSKDAQRVAAVVATLGGRVPVARIRRALDLAPAVLDAALDELEWGGWLEAEARGYAFVARVVGQVVEETLVSKGEKERVRDQGSGARV